ncbi:hypothetical protein [Ruegeria meonggei]|uniref:hypothetical protein n=1 Tax=Ruegeria meonggei TaxID=1446476 RepID=UPI000A26CDF5|nr:hypothetical protein [Ruegeria meonggei]
MFGDVIAEALKKIRYCEPDPDDGNRARWSNHEIWNLVAASSEDDLLEMRSHIDATSIKHVHRTDQIWLISAQMAGLGITLAAIGSIRSNAALSVNCCRSLDARRRRIAAPTSAIIANFQGV